MAQEPSDNPAKPKTTIETRGEGGYILAPGSPGECHPTGGTYEVIAGDLCALPVITMEERAVLFECARALSRWFEAADVGETGDSGQAYVDDTLGESPGDRFGDATSWGDILGPHGYQLSRKDCWTRPGKKSGTSATTCCVSKAGRSLLKIHSTNDPFFEYLKTYSKFGAFAVLNHGGDFSAAAKDLAAKGFGGAKAGTNTAENDSENEYLVLPESEDAFAMTERYTELAEPVIHGLLRVGETMNVIAASKMHKSFMVLDLGLSIASGRPWMGIDGFAVARKRVHLVDNELHRPVLASRVRAVAEAKGMKAAEYRGRFSCDCLRGRLADITCMDKYFAALADGGIDLVILDALYRFWPPDTSENDNAAATAIFNRLDRWASEAGCAFVCIHHASKGLQSGKQTTDVGAGAGAISRAADTHLILRPHAKEKLVVLDAVTRSFPPVESCSLEWDYPLWTRSNETPELHVGPTAADHKQKNKDAEAVDQLLKVMTEIAEPVTKGRLRKETGFGAQRVDRLVRLALDAERIRKSQDIEVRGKPESSFELV